MATDDCLSWGAANAYISAMSKLLEKAVELVRSLPAESQDEIACAMMQLAGRQGEAEPVDPSHLPAVLEGLAEARAGSLATAEAVEAAFRRFDP
jgi:enoyl-CoA hydratase/carnithine racemase